MSDTQDLHDLLARVLYVLRAHQEAMFQNTLAIHACVEALKESDSTFADAYDRHYWEAKQGKIGEENATANRMIENIRQQLKQSEHEESAKAQGAH